MAGAEYEMKGLQARKVDLRGTAQGTEKSPSRTHGQTLNIASPPACYTTLMTLESTLIARR